MTEFESEDEDEKKDVVNDGVEAESVEDLMNNVIEEISEEVIGNEQEILLTDETINQDGLESGDAKEEDTNVSIVSEE